MTAGCLLVREAGGLLLRFFRRAGIPDSGNLIAGNHHVTAAMAKAIAGEVPAELL
jgi:myo-inositol-1(or 4)-monophosphatase